MSKLARRGRPRREEIINAAIKSFYRNGYAATTLATVARHLNVTDKALYYYVQSKDDLYLQCQHACLDRVAALIALIDRSGEPGIEKIKSLACALIRQSENCLPFVRKLPVHLAGTALGARLREAERAHTEACAAWIRDGISDGSIRPADPHVLWRWNMGALVWLGIWSPDDHEEGEDFREFLVSQAMAMLERSLSRKGSS